MKTLSWIGRFLGGLGVLGLVAVGVLVWVFTGWKQEREAALVAGSRVVETRLGAVEYVDEGDGPAVLVLHGAPGGFDQGRLFGSALRAEGFRVIAPSRPGYLRTPLESGLLIADQAELMDALLEELGIESVAVLGVSVGASVALDFARASPNKTVAVVVISMITQRSFDEFNLPQTEELLEERVLMDTTGDMGTWFASVLAARRPEALLGAVLDRDSILDAGEKTQLATEVVSNDRRLAFFRDLTLTIAPLEDRESGTRNDLLMMKAMENADLSDIAAPILVINGGARSAREWTDTDQLLESATDARELKIPGVGRLVWLSPEVDAMNLEIVDFLRQAMSDSEAEVTRDNRSLDEETASE